MKKFLNNLYIVKKGDTIESIAKKYMINSMSILLQNNVTPKMIKEGMILYISRDFN